MAIFQRSAARVTLFRMALCISGVSAAAIVVGGTAAWLLERDVPDRSFRSWGDAVWWALTTLTTVGYGDRVPVTVPGRLVGAMIMITGVAVLGGVAAVVALAVARAVAGVEERALEVEAESLERRLEAHLGRIDARLARIEARLDERERREPGSRSTAAIGNLGCSGTRSSTPPSCDLA
jgi:voltage-gated potassium channel